jgi:hypothetical protein
MISDCHSVGMQQLVLDARMLHSHAVQGLALTAVLLKEASVCSYHQQRSSACCVRADWDAAGCHPQL